MATAFAVHARAGMHHPCTQTSCTGELVAMRRCQYVPVTTSSIKEDDCPTCLPAVQVQTGSSNFYLFPLVPPVVIAVMALHAKLANDASPLRSHQLPIVHIVHESCAATGRSCYSCPTPPVPAKTFVCCIDPGHKVSGTKFRKLTRQSYQYQ